MNLEKKEKPKRKVSRTEKVAKVCLLVAFVIGIFYLQHRLDAINEKEEERHRKVIEAAEAKEEKAAQLKKLEEKQKEKKIQKKREELVSNYLKLPGEKFELETYDIDDNKGSKYYVVAEGKGYTVRFNKDSSKIDKFVQVPMVTDEDGDSDSTSDSPSVDVYTDSSGMPIIIPRSSSGSSSGIKSKSSSGSSYKSSSGGSSRSSYRSSTRSSSRR